jgi:hypothetical protein
MAPPIPSIVHINWTADDEAGFVQALHDAYDSGSIPEFIVMFATGTPIGSEGFIIESVSEGWQISIRRTGVENEFKVALDPLGNFLTAGDASTAPTLTDSTEWTGEQASMLTFSDTATDAIVWAVDDATAIMNYVSGNSYFENMFIGGRWFEPATKTDTDEYVDGLMIAGNLATTELDVNGIFTTNTINNQITRIKQTGWSALSVAAWPGSRSWGSALTAAWDFGGAVSTKRPVSVIAYMPESSGGQRVLGVIKYIYHSPILGTAKVRLEDSGSIVRYMFFFNSAATNTQLILWNNTVAPLL